MNELSWLVDGFEARVPGVTAALVVSADGLPLARSAGLGIDLADQLAAVASGLASLTHGAARLLRTGSCREVLVEMDGGVLLVTTVSQGAVLAVLATPSADLGLVGYETELLVSRVGPALSPALRSG